MRHRAARAARRASVQRNACACLPRAARTLRMACTHTRARVTAPHYTHARSAHLPACHALPRSCHAVSPPGYLRVPVPQDTTFGFFTLHRLLRGAHTADRFHLTCATMTPDRARSTLPAVLATGFCRVHCHALPCRTCLPRTHLTHVPRYACLLPVLVDSAPSLRISFYAVHSHHHTTYTVDHAALQTRGRDLPVPHISTTAQFPHTILLHRSGLRAFYISLHGYLPRTRTDSRAHHSPHA